MYLRLFSDFSHKHFVTYSQSLPKDATGGDIPASPRNSRCLARSDTVARWCRVRRPGITCRRARLPDWMATPMVFRARCCADEDWLIGFENRGVQVTNQSGVLYLSKTWAMLVGERNALVNPL